MYVITVAHPVKTKDNVHDVQCEDGGCLQHGIETLSRRRSRHP